MENREIIKTANKAHRFNFIDLLLLIIIIAAAALLVYILLGHNILGGNEDVTILYSVEMNIIRDIYIETLKETDLSELKGTRVIDSIKTYDIGEIWDLKITDAYQNQKDSSGEVKKQHFPDHSKITLTIKANCKKVNDKYMINGSTIMVGEAIYFRTPYLVSYGYCVAIEEINKKD